MFLEQWKCQQMLKINDYVTIIYKKIKLLQSISSKQKKDLRINNFASETEIYFITGRNWLNFAEERSRKNFAYDPNAEERKSFKQKINVAKTLNKVKYSEKILIKLCLDHEKRLHNRDR